MTNGFIRKELKKVVEDIRTNEYSAQNVKELVGTILTNAQKIAAKVKEYTRSVEHLNFNPDLLLMTIEQIMFKKFYLFLKTIYNKANNERDLAFKKKIKAIQSQSTESVFDFLEVKQKYRLTPKSDAISHGYQFAVDELNKLGYLEHPYDKLVN